MTGTGCPTYSAAARIVLVATALVAAACATTDQVGVVQDETAETAVTRALGLSGGVLGTVTFIGPDNRAYRVSIEEGPQLEDVSDALEELGGQGEEGWINTSRDSKWILVESTRFGCADIGACLVVVTGDLSLATPVLRPGSEFIQSGGLGTISQDGTLIVYPSNDGPHESDIWIIRKTGDAWGDPTLITDDSRHQHHAHPILSPNDDEVLFDCGSSYYSQEGTGICRVDLGVPGMTDVVGPADGPDSDSSNSVHSPAYLPDGTIVFEADWRDSEAIWRRDSSGGLAVVNQAFSNDNSPCVLPQGYIASLWLGRPGGEGIHEIKIMDGNGEAFLMAVVDRDVQDIGIGCGD